MKNDNIFSVYPLNKSYGITTAWYEMYCIILVHFGTWTFAVVIEAATESSKQGYFSRHQAPSVEQSAVTSFYWTSENI